MNFSTIGNTYLNFVVGTGSERFGRVLKDTIKYRKAHNLSYVQAFTTGIARGVKKSYNHQVRTGGYIKSLQKGFSAIPQGWKTGGLKGAFKGCGKAMPALFAGLMLFSEVPNIIKSVKEKGIVQGLKETGKSAFRLTCGAVGGALGTLVPGIPLIGTMVGWSFGEWVGSKLVGESYSQQVADAEEKHKQSQMQNSNQSNITLACCA